MVSSGKLATTNKLQWSLSSYSPALQFKLYEYNIILQYVLYYFLHFLSYIVEGIKFIYLLIVLLFYFFCCQTYWNILWVYSFELVTIFNYCVDWYCKFHNSIFKWKGDLFSSKHCSLPRAPYFNSSLWKQILCQDKWDGECDGDSDNNFPVTNVAAILPSEVFENSWWKLKADARRRRSGQSWVKP